ncbi:MAG: hypothetical protein HYZ36_02565, partial [Pedosphaera parvula]|nr:hypothetical protein [Pedosphaera parvula]
PAEVPYLAAPSLASDRFSTLQATTKFKVGLVWAGNPQHKNDLNRSIPLSRFAPLLATPNTAFFGLQVGPRSADLAQLTANRPVDLSGSLRSFSDTAAVLNALDLLISVDTSVVHLAGALGRPVWTLVPFVPDWRWLMDRDDTPWYPPMRLFRQPVIGDWDSAIQTVGRELERLTAMR